MMDDAVEIKNHTMSNKINVGVPHEGRHEEECDDGRRFDTHT